MRDIRIRLGLVALLIFLSTGLARSNAYGSGAAVCYYAGLSYSEGACRGGQRCSASGTWVDDSNCPKSDEELAT
jgi:hypothetical protein